MVKSLIFTLLTSLVLLQTQATTCSEEWEKILNSNNNPSEKYKKMHSFSGFHKNDLGEYEKCLGLAGAEYVVLRFFKSPVNVQAFCGPSVCTEEDYQKPSSLGLSLIYNSSYEVLFPAKIQSNKYSSFTWGAIIMMTYIAILITTCLISGVLDHFKNISKQPDLPSQIFSAFSLKKNFFSLIERPRHSKIYSHTGFLNANKVLSIFWIITAHTFQYHYFYPALSNIDEAFETTKNWMYFFVYGAFYAVDTFFWGVGFGLTYQTVMEMKTNRTASMLRKFIHAFLNRYLFLSSTYFFFVFFFWTLQEFLGSGPLWVDLGDSVKDCDSFWYTNILYLNIYIPDFKGNFCLAAGWYISADLQFFIVVLILSSIYFKYGEKPLLTVSANILLICMIATFSISYYFNLSPSFFSAETGKNYYYYYYSKPYSRIAPCLFGILCGVITVAWVDSKHEQKDFLLYKQGKRSKISITIAELYKYSEVKILSFIMGIFGLTLLILISFDLYDNPGPGDSYRKWTVSSNLEFLAFEKVLFGICLSLIMLPVALRHFKIVSQGLSSHFFFFLGKLNFCVFLVHNNLIEIWYKSQKKGEVFSTWNNLVDAFMFILICEVCAVPAVLFVEMPVMNLYHIYIRRY